MKKFNAIMMVGIMTAIMMAVSCKREYGTVTLGVNIDIGRDSKVYIDDLTPCWHNNDQIRVNDQTCITSAALGSSAQITDVVESNSYRAIYPADIVGNVDISSSNTIPVTLPHEQLYEEDGRGEQKVKVPMGAFSLNESLTFHNLCSLIKVVVSNQMDDDFILDRITVTANSSYLSGQGDATVSGTSSDWISMISSSSNHDVSLVFPAANRPTIGRGDRDTYVYYIVAPEFAEGDVTITLYSQGECAIFEKRATLQHNRMAQVSLTVEQFQPQAGVLSGAFSVSATQQVHFSQGNLQYQASTNVWRFAEHQWDYVGTRSASANYNGGTVSGSDNSNISSTYSGWIDLFCWGASGWDNGAICYQPWSASSNDDDYYSGWSLTGAYAEADWAWHNAISNGGGVPYLWRTLTASEWFYLLYERTNATAKLGSGNINGVGGLIILPDDWTQPSSCSFTSGFESEYSGWTHNSYSRVQWEQMEANGALFLPAAGYRYGTSVENLGYMSWGYYWTSEYVRNPAVYMCFGSYDIHYYYWWARSIACSVRPVRVNN